MTITSSKTSSLQGFLRKNVTTADHELELKCTIDMMSLTKWLHED